MVRTPTFNIYILVLGYPPGHKHTSARAELGTYPCQMGSRVSSRRPQAIKTKREVQCMGISDSAITIRYLKRRH